MQGARWAPNRAPCYHSPAMGTAFPIPIPPCAGGLVSIASRRGPRILKLLEGCIDEHARYHQLVVIAVEHRDGEILHDIYAAPGLRFHELLGILEYAKVRHIEWSRGFNEQDDEPSG